MTESQVKWEHIKSILGQARIVLEALMTASENLDPTIHGNVREAKNRLDESLQSEESLKKAVEQIQEGDYQKLVARLEAETNQIPPHIRQKVRQRLNQNS